MQPRDSMTLRSRAGAFPELAAAVAVLEPDLRVRLDVPIGIRPPEPDDSPYVMEAELDIGWPYVLVLAWACAAASIVFAGVTLPRLETFRKGLDEAPVAFRSLPSIWAVASSVAAATLTWTSRSAFRGTPPHPSIRAGVVLVVAVTVMLIFSFYVQCLTQP
jgi:hypothetical protein